MASYRVTKVRKEAPALNPSHEHIVGVVTDDGAYHTVQEVVDSIRGGDVWRAFVEGEPEAMIGIEPFCSRPWCMHSPYLSSTPGETLATDLERLPRG
ncbi:MAG TPA: DUF3892 domain-containing protein [Anaeromyxobacteraceae bacterium]|nr:DUF3892 domain-containing protein [Anaeromyxobacteraceae bacterium]